MTCAGRSDDGVEDSSVPPGDDGVGAPVALRFHLPSALELLQIARDLCLGHAQCVGDSLLRGHHRMPCKELRDRFKLGFQSEWNVARRGGRRYSWALATHLRGCLQLSLIGSDRDDVFTCRL